jgi:hypothetical protein
MRIRSKEGKEKEAARQKLYRENNRELLCMKAKAYYEANKSSAIRKSVERRKKKRLLQKIEKTKKTKEELALQRKIYKEAHKEQIAVSARAYYKKNKEKLIAGGNTYRKKKLSEDPVYKLASRLRNNVNRSIKDAGFRKSCSTIEILGCSFDFLRTHLESKFESWMNWGNHGKFNGTTNFGWDIDHIIPLSSGVTEEDILKLNHYTNLQPLCSYVNRHVKRDLVDFKHNNKNE